MARRKRIEAGDRDRHAHHRGRIPRWPGAVSGAHQSARQHAGRKCAQWVAKYHDLGYPQIKIYSSVKPELVPVIVEEAHKNGMRVSGHIPAGHDRAADAIRAGFDEMQHMNFVFLNFMPDVKETRTPARFIEPAKRPATST